MKLKLIDEDWIDESISLLNNEEMLDREDMQRVNGKIRMLQIVKQKLQSSKEEIEKAFKVGLEAAKDLQSDNAEFELEVNYLEQYLKDNIFV